MKNKAYTLVEILVVVALFTLIFGSTLSLIYYSNQSWRVGKLKQETQQEARKALDFIALALRESSPAWVVNGQTYQIEINAAGDAIKFYVPVIDNSGVVTSLEEIRIYCAGQDNKQLFKVVGENPPQALTDARINNIAANKPFFQFLNASNSEILIRIPVIITNAINNDTFVLTSIISLRNVSSNLGAVVVEEIVGEEGDF